MSLNLLPSLKVAKKLQFTGIDAFSKGAAEAIEKAGGSLWREIKDSAQLMFSSKSEGYRFLRNLSRLPQQQNGILKVHVIKLINCLIRN